VRLPKMAYGPASTKLFLSQRSVFLWARPTGSRHVGRHAMGKSESGWLQHAHERMAVSQVAVESVDAQKFTVSQCLLGTFVLGWLQTWDPNLTDSVSTRMSTLLDSSDWQIVNVRVVSGSKITRALQKYFPAIRKILGTSGSLLSAPLFMQID